MKLQTKFSVIGLLAAMLVIALTAVSYQASFYSISHIYKENA
jgi:hypothetical protein